MTLKEKMIDNIKLFVSLMVLPLTVHAGMALNPDVKQATIKETICVSGYTSKVRPSVSYTNGVKKKLMRAEGLDVTTINLYELDHIVPLALGGHPRSLDNLMLQKWDGDLGAKVKDKLERRLQLKVCSGELRLSTAQSCIYTNWQACAKKYPK